MQLTTLGRTYDLQEETEQPSSLSPLIKRTDHGAPSIFRPENMLREARRQKGIGAGLVPRICILDPDGDLVDFVRSERRARKSAYWACYHTSMWEWYEAGIGYGIIGHAVGGPFAVLVAEQLFVSGCSLLISVASAGQIADQAMRSYHILIERSLRDEGTSHHYLPPEPYAEADADLLRLAKAAFGALPDPILSGATWTTDAPFRETENAISRRKAEGLLAVEMEAAALYAFAAARKCDVLCLAHVTNQFGCVEGDFEKGPGNGAKASLGLVASIAKAWIDKGGVRS